ncbi:tRNA (guanine(9)-N(1))-methyltransferase, partial [Exophiala xenobiotica]
MDMQSRKVLTTNHVVEIMIRWLECGDWGEAFMKVIPKRKGGKLRGESKPNADGSDGEENDHEQNDSELSTEQ